MTAFDNWLTTPPAFTPVEVTCDEWADDPNGDEYAPFDETTCTGCDAIIGAHLRVDPETTADIPSWTPFWAMDEDYGTLFCEDCWYAATEEVE
ncbi:MAG: hypothetical protein ACOYOQ_00375 [Microthrixaceae bacterium]